VCPKCEASVNKTIGEVETKILTTLPVEGSLSLDTLTTKTNFKRETIKEALRHLIDMGYLTTTPKWNYSLGTKGKKEKAKIE
jgi:DNA-binding IclR family transcriptional regulator